MKISDAKIFARMKTAWVDRGNQGKAGEVLADEVDRLEKDKKYLETDNGLLKLIITQLMGREANANKYIEELETKLSLYEETLNNDFIVYSHLSKHACLRTSANNVADTLEAFKEALIESK